MCWFYDKFCGGAIGNASGSGPLRGLTPVNWVLRRHTHFECGETRAQVVEYRALHPLQLDVSLRLLEHYWNAIPLLRFSNNQIQYTKARLLLFLETGRIAARKARSRKDYCQKTAWEARASDARLARSLARWAISSVQSSQEAVSVPVHRLCSSDRWF
jgi:hypothetical protein